MKYLTSTIGVENIPARWWEEESETVSSIQEAMIQIARVSGNRDAFPYVVRPSYHHPKIMVVTVPGSRMPEILHMFLDD